MINQEIEQEIIKYISNQYRPRWISLNNDWKIYLLQRWNNCNNIKESYLRIKYNIIDIPKCPICGNNCKFRGNNWIYDNTCGNKDCQNSLRNIKSKQTKLERYGDENYNNSKQGAKNKNYQKIQEKIKKTCLEKYGVTNGGGSKESLNKIRNTLLEKYGVESTWKIEQVIQKSKQTKLERYGDEKYTNREKAKKTYIQKYGVDNPFKNKEIQNKYKQTCLEKYGVDHNWKIKEEHKLTNTLIANNKKKKTSLNNWGTEFPSQSNIIQSKINNTKKKNHTFNTSISETESYKLLKEKYPNVKYQYKSDVYPFVCDFYIPELDLYIECNYHWTHGGKPYEGTEEDNIIIGKWKAKNTKFYNNAINCWTIRDVNKRNIAKENNLNYLEFWNIKELKNWIDI